ncbi:hypothetical protein B0H14DRAFT_3667896 [Mycena olivaceomarginata]|nr:hypothetical protein B0H14DRAFT_3667896 [Mycena olivaceomarginata]
MVRLFLFPAMAPHKSPNLFPLVKHSGPPPPDCSSCCPSSTWDTIFEASATGAKKIAMNWVQYWKKIKLNGDKQKEVKEMYEEMVTSGERKAKDAPGRRVWEEDQTTDEEGTRQKEKERRKAEKEKEKRKAEKEKEKAKVKARKSEKGSKKRKADDTTDPHPAKHQSTSRKVDPPSAKHKSTAGDGGRSQKKRKRQDDSDSDEPTPKSRSKQAPDAPKSRFEVMHNRFRVLATGKSGSITTKLPPAMRKGPPGVRLGTVEFTALGLKGMDEDSDDDSDSDN